MFGQVGFFNKFAGKAYEDKRPRDRYVAESVRLLGVLDERLADRRWVMGADYSIADISLLGWVRNLIGFYEAPRTRRLRPLSSRPGVARPRPRASGGAARTASSGGLEKIRLRPDHYRYEDARRYAASGVTESCPDTLYSASVPG